MNNEAAKCVHLSEQAAQFLRSLCPERYRFVIDAISSQCRWAHGAPVVLRWTFENEHIYRVFKARKYEFGDFRIIFRFVDWQTIYIERAAYRQDNPYGDE